MRRSASSSIVALAAVMLSAVGASSVAQADPRGSVHSGASSAAKSPWQIDSARRSTAALLSGQSLLIDRARRLHVSTGCASVGTGTTSSFGQVAYTVTAKRHPARVTVGPYKLAVPRQTTRTRDEWVRLRRGQLRVCDHNADRFSIKLLAHAGSPSTTRIGGLVDVTSRIPLRRASRDRAFWVYPHRSVPTGAAGVLVQVSAGSPGAILVHVGRVSVPVEVGPRQPAVTLVLPSGRLRWSRISGQAKPSAILLGFITAPTDNKLGGARLRVPVRPFAATGKELSLAGHHGLPGAGSSVPATSVFAAVSGHVVGVRDPLAQNRLTSLNLVPNRLEGTALRLDNRGSVSLSSTVHARVFAWLSGDVVRAPHSIDLAQPGAVKPISAPVKGELVFPARAKFAVGDALVLGDSKVTPGGLIAMVDSLGAGSGGDVVVRYHKGGLLDAFSELDLVTQVPLRKSKKSAHDARHDVTIGGGVSKDFNAQKSFTFGKNPSISGDVSVDFHPSMTVDITIHTATIFPIGLSVHFALDGSTSISASLTASGSVSGSQDFPLGHALLGAIELGPVTVVPEFSAELDASFSASATVTISRSISESAHVGETVSATVGHGFSKSGDGNNGFSRPTIDSSSPPSISAKADANATISFEFDLAIEGVAGPDAKASAGIDFSVNPTANPWWKVQATGDLSIGIDLNALDIPLLTKLLDVLQIDSDPSWSLGHLSYTLASANGPLGGTTGGGGSGSGTGSGSDSPVLGGSSIGPVPAGSYPETDGSVSHTWTDYSDGGGSEGPSIAPNQTVGVACQIAGLHVPDGNTAWYQISSGPWNSDYYVSSDAFYNNGQTSGSLLGTPYVDPAVPTCRGASGQSGAPNGLTGTTETTGSQANTWSDFSDAGGTAGPAIASKQTVLIGCRLGGFTVADGNTWWYQVASSPWSDNFYVSADAFYNNGSTSGSLHGTPFVDTAVPVCGGGGGGGGGGGPTTTETTGSVTHTWTDSADAGGTEGPAIASGESVQIACRVTGFAVADSNTWWYQIASAPWDNTYFASADAFYNNGSTSGSLHGTPFVDTAVPVCGGGGVAPPPPATWAETTGSVAHTWTDYVDAGGTEGPEISSNDTVQITCRLTGFQVQDGNVWWYRIASSPWSNGFYVSSDAFYNDGATSGSLHGTPFVDTNVALC